MSAPDGELTVRPTPCVTCPYRRDVPSGVWARQEYDALRDYDGTVTEQAMAGATGVFMCHQGDAQVCGGWAGCHDMNENLALRLPLAKVDVAILSYASPVPLFASGAEAADHGQRDLDNPGPAARAAIGKIARVRAARGKPVTTTPEGPR